MTTLYAERAFWHSGVVAPDRVPTQSGFRRLFAQERKDRQPERIDGPHRAGGFFDLYT
jgi:hypothetical protein